MANNDRHPNAWIGDMRRVADTRLVQDLVNDFRNYSPTPRADPSAKVQVQGAPTVKTGDVGPQHRPIDTDATTDRSGWQEAPKVDDWKPPGVEIMDQMMDQQDRIDRAQRIRELGMAQHARRLAEAAREAEDKDKAHKDGKLKP
jgi:hypothetical protein